MVTANTALAGISSAFALIYAFWTGTIFVIYELAFVNYQAAIYIIGLVLILVVPIYQMISGKRIIDVSRRNLAIIMLVALVVQPYVVQGQYNPDGLDVYSPIVGGHEVTIADVYTSFYYYNTSGNGIWNPPAETQDGNGTWDVTLSATNQDLDKKAILTAYFKDASTVSDYWNSTAFDQDTDDHIVAIGVRIQTEDLGKRFYYEIGLNTADTAKFFKGYIYSSTSITLIHIPVSFYELIDEYTGAGLADDPLYMYFTEADADQLVTGAEVEIEVRFYSSISTDGFNEYMLYCGLLNILIAGAMTKYWNPTGTRRRRRYRYPRRSYRYRRPRYSYRRRR